MQDQGIYSSLYDGQFRHASVRHLCNAGKYFKLSSDRGDPGSKTCKRDYSEYVPCFGVFGRNLVSVAAKTLYHLIQSKISEIL
jgi:hypothetical protein